MAAGELTRILLNHPDIDLRQVASDTEAGKRLSAVHRGLVGDTELTFSPALQSEGLDVVFLCGEAWAARRFVEGLPKPTSANEAAETHDKGDRSERPDRRSRHQAEEEEPLRIIDLTGAFRNPASGEGDPMVYGLPEWNRKALVRGAQSTSLPSAAAMALELALFPLAKNMRLEGPVAATVEIATTEDYQNAPAPETSREESVRLDPIAPCDFRPDPSAAASEASALLRSVLGPGSRDFKMTVRSARAETMPRGIVAEVVLPSALSVGELRAMFDEAYSDHSFVYTVDSPPTALDVANTNKCLIHIGEADPADGSPFRAVRIIAVIDNLLKGSAGNAVHCLNLLFGLSERTGLSLKASAF